MNDREVERFFNPPTDDRWNVPSRLRASPSYFMSEGYLSQHEKADWQSTGFALRQFAGAFDARMRKLGIPVVCDEAQAFGVRLLHARYRQMTRDEWQLFAFVGSEVAEKLGHDIDFGQWRGQFDPAAWTMEVDFDRPKSPDKVQRWTLKALRRHYPAKEKR